MTPEEQQAYRAKYLRILENDALTVMRNLALLEVMDTERRKLGVEGKHPAAYLLNALKGWRNTLLVHSLQDQISSHTPDEYSITPHQLAEILEQGISVIHAYSRKNGFRSVSRLPEKFFPDAQNLMPGVDKMIGGLFA